ncbi:prolyl-tRNA synthetase [Cenarchaeum symbiosum A]|uniref:Proline--tRNA ligase n=1 Tax=Cenarchaeum symbiosum (strain A) TaxID=414004 RepID=SYP_CENSY|nr:RecName: Full=Proline--tRNA ligase; AltName: Full=Prolyl-tRNA synthetase; Short=ProRS [Cenarchaeum symbiosum A]ABK77005.1 prolyl-tRNA synthetase [Cenarchaeum symbiosum A]
MKVGITASKSDDFSEWYTQVVLKAELADYAPVKGLIVLRPDGYSIWESIRTSLDVKLAARGVRNGFLPVLIPESLLGKEKEHFAGFNPEVFWVTHSGENKVGDRLALRPTSETLAYSLYSKWIKSWRDLPLRINFWNTALRAEIKSTKPFLRTSEFLWQEGHTVHACSEEAESEVAAILELYRETVEGDLAIPVITGRKSEKEKFVGAVYTTTMESMMPDGRALQMGTSHFLGQNFSRPFEVKFADKDNVEHFAWQTSWGLSWRLIGAMIMVHGDDKGLVLPPKVAPLQVVIIPISYSGEEGAQVLAAAEGMEAELLKAGIRARTDKREELTPGFKFHDWEMRGVPVRIEIGPRDLKDGSAVLATRHDGKKSKVPLDGAAVNIEEELCRVQTEMLGAAKRALDGMIHDASSYGALTKAVEGGGFVRAAWCGGLECEEKVKEETGADIRVVPEGGAEGACIVCGGRAASIPLFARGY